MTELAPDNHTYDAPDEDAKGRDLLELLSILRRRLFMVIVVVLLGTGLALFGTLQLTPLYTATADIMIDSQGANVVDVQEILGGLGTDSGTIESQVQVISSRSLVRRLVNKLELTTDPEFNPALRKGEGFIATLSRSGKQFINELLGRTPLASSEERTLAVTVDQVLNRLDVEREGLTFIIHVSFTSEDPAKATLIANTLAELYLLEQFEARFEATQRANDWLNERLVDLQEEVRLAEVAIEQYRSENNLVEVVGNSVIESQLAGLNSQLAMLRAERAEAQAKYDQVRNLVAAGGDASSIADVLGSPTIASLKSDETELIRREAELSSKYGDLHPELINVRAERADLEAQMEREVERIITNLANEVAVASAREQSIRSSLDSLTEDVVESNRASVELAELERVATSARTLYENFLGRFQETEQQETSQQSDARIISAATRPVGTSFPNLKLNVAIGFFLSTLTGIGLALMIDRLDRGFRTAEHVETSLGLPLIATIPTAGRFANRPKTILDQIIKKPASVFTESLRTLRTGVALSNVDHPPKVVLFTSSVPGEGKTTTAAAFARTAAMSGVNVILVDSDLRRPNVHRLLDMKVDSGIVKVLTGESTIDEAIRKDSATGLDVLCVTETAASPPDLLSSQHMREMVAELRERYDLVILDSPPVSPVSDAKILGQIVDTTVFVIHWDETPRELASRAVRELRLSGIPIAGAAFAQVNLKKQARSYYGGYGMQYYRKYATYYSS